jgi:hypothetical protein
MTKPKVEAPDDPAACITIAQKVQFSLKRREIYEATVCAYDAPPSALDSFLDRYPIIESMPWTHPSWCEEFARKERARREIERELRRHEE